MTSEAPKLDLGLTPEGRNVVIVGGKLIDSLPALMDAAPALAGAPAELARAVNHLGAGDAFRVIVDVMDYARATRARLESEPAGEPWREGVFRLRDHGVPDIKALAAPAVADGRLVFFAEDTLLGAPYRVEVDLSGPAPDEADYAALPLRPLPPVAPAPNPYFTGDRPELVPPDEDVLQPISR